MTLSFWHLLNTFSGMSLWHFACERRNPLELTKFADMPETSLRKDRSTKVSIEHLRQTYTSPTDLYYEYSQLEIGTWYFGTFTFRHEQKCVAGLCAAKLIPERKQMLYEVQEMFLTKRRATFRENQTCRHRQHKHLLWVPHKSHKFSIPSICFQSSAFCFSSLVLLWPSSVCLLMGSLGLSPKVQSLLFSVCVLEGQTMQSKTSSEFTGCTTFSNWLFTIEVSRSARQCSEVPESEAITSWDGRGEAGQISLLSRLAKQSAASPVCPFLVA